MPVDGSASNDATPMFAGHSGTALGDSIAVVIRVYDGSSVGNGAVATGTTTADPSGAWALDLSSPLDPGTYTARATQSDAAENTGRSAKRTFTLTTPAAFPASDPVVLAAGDIGACDSNGDGETANLLDQYPAATVLPLGDNAYESGTASQYANCYDPTWGRSKTRSRPVPGNHDYLTANASGYFNYFNAQLAPFGAAATVPTRGWYSYDLGAWHVVALNDQCAFMTGGCDSASPEVQWLQADLAAHPTQCTIAYFHEPLFSSGANGSSDDKPLWQALYAAGADVVLNGHDHDYERFAPQTPNGTLDLANGISEFVVGTGGIGFFTFNGSPAPNGQVRNSNTFGVLRLTLHANSYEWKFLPVAGSTFTDTGSRTCN
jgi:hypothetical protein